MKERTLQFGAESQLTGTICSPEAASQHPGAPGLILLNAGILHRIGPHRFNVRLARRAAQLGIASIRFDLSGRGDSGPARRGMHYRDQAVADIRAAVETLAGQKDRQRFMLFGICSGADDGYAAALAEPRIASVVMFDPYMFATLRWRVRLYASKLRKYGVVGGLARLRTIHKVQNSEEDAVLDNYGREVPPIAAYAADLRRLAERGTSIHLIYSGSSCDQLDYQAQRRMLLTRYGLDRLVRTEFIPEVDHVITSLAAQERILSRLGDWIDAAGTAPGGAAA